MRLIVGTHTGLYLITLDLEKDNALIQVLNYGYYYGIAVWEDRFIAARRTLCLSKLSPTTFEAYNMEGEFAFIPDIDGAKIVDCHQITSGKKGLYITNSANRRLDYVNQQLSEAKHITFTKDPDVDFRINSVSIYGDDLYLCRHNRDIKPSEIFHLKHTDESWVMCGRYPIMDYGVHNLVYDSGWMFYNASDEGKVKAVYLPSYTTEDWERKGSLKTHEIEIEESSHTKGMAVHETLLLVGVSEKVDTMSRFSSQSSIALVDLSINKVIGVLPLRQNNGLPLGNINEIRVLPPLSSKKIAPIGTLEQATETQTL